MDYKKGYVFELMAQGANSTFDNNYMDGETTYRYYNEMMWPKRFASCISVDEAIKMICLKIL